MSDNNGQKYRKYLWLVFLFLTLNLLLLFSIFSLYIVGNGVSSLVSVGGAKISQSNLDEKTDSYTKLDLGESKDKLENFAESEVESLEIQLTEAEVNSLIQEHINAGKEEKKADEPDDESLRENGLGGFTAALSSSFVNIEKLKIEANLLDEKMEIYVSLDGGSRWFIVVVSSDTELQDEFDCPVVIENFRSNYPEFVNQWVISELNLGMQDAFGDFNEKNISGRKISSVRFRDGVLVLIGTKQTAKSGS